MFLAVQGLHSYSSPSSLLLSSREAVQICCTSSYRLGILGTLPARQRTRDKAVSIGKFVQIRAISRAISVTLFSCLLDVLVSNASRSGSSPTLCAKLMFAAVNSPACGSVQHLSRQLASSNQLSIRPRLSSPSILGDSKRCLGRGVGRDSQVACSSSNGAGPEPSERPDPDSNGAADSSKHKRRFRRYVPVPVV